MRRVALFCVAAVPVLWATLVCGQETAAGMPPAAADAPAILSAPAQLSVAEYSARLDALARALSSGRYDEAHAAADSLKAARITWQQETLAPDTGLLEDAGRANTPAAAQRVARRVELLAQALRAAPTETAARAEPEALARVTHRDDLTSGGTIDARLTAPPLGPFERLQKLLERIDSWMTDAWKRLKPWLKRFWPSAPLPSVDPAQMSRTTTIVLLVVGLATLLIALLAVRAVFRQNDAPIQSETSQTAARLDDDPLSREASEWERYAEQLAAAGRRREAIRAWYHAVLVTLFRMGLLHHSRGRTNWEYVSDLSPELRWRALFVDLTRGFDLEWYGRDASSAQALAAYARHGRSVLRALEAGEAGA